MSEQMIAANVVGREAQAHRPAGELLDPPSGYHRTIQHEKGPGHV